MRLFIESESKHCVNQTEDCELKLIAKQEERTQGRIRGRMVPGATKQERKELGGRGWSKSEFMVKEK